MSPTLKLIREAAERRLTVGGAWMKAESLPGGFSTTAKKKTHFTSKHSRSSIAATRYLHCCCCCSRSCRAARASSPGSSASMWADKKLNAQQTVWQWRLQHRLEIHGLQRMSSLSDPLTFPPQVSRMMFLFHQRWQLLLKVCVERTGVLSDSCVCSVHQDGRHGSLTTSCLKFSGDICSEVKITKTFLFWPTKRAATQRILIHCEKTGNKQADVFKKLLQKTSSAIRSHIPIILSIICTYITSPCCNITRCQSFRGHMFKEAWVCRTLRSSSLIITRLKQKPWRSSSRWLWCSETSTHYQST